MRYFLIWVISISVIAVAVTVYDKLAAKKFPKRRVRESALLLTGVLGGAAAMYATMRAIHHKTRHRKFMLGLPVMTVIQVLLCAVAAAVYFK